MAEKTEDNARMDLDTVISFSLFTISLLLCLRHRILVGDSLEANKIQDKCAIALVLIGICNGYTIGSELGKVAPDNHFPPTREIPVEQFVFWLFLPVPVLIACLVLCRTYSQVLISSLDARHSCRCENLNAELRVVAKLDGWSILLVSWCLTFNESVALGLGGFELLCSYGRMHREITVGCGICDVILWVSVVTILAYIVRALRCVTNAMLAEVPRCGCPALPEIMANEEDEGYETA